MLLHQLNDKTKKREIKKVRAQSPITSEKHLNYNFRHKLLGRFDHEQNFSKILFILSNYAVIT